MKTKKQLLSDSGVFRLGYYIALFGTALILLWIGIFKFTPTEAAAIKPLIEHHPFSFWVYDLLCVQAVFNLVGLTEIAVALLLLLSLKFHPLRRYAGLGIMAIFLITLSFLIFTPGMWRIRDGVIITDYFILKDIAYLGFGAMLFGSPKE